MKLYWSPASPYARKVRATAREKGLAGRIDEIIVETAQDPAALIAANPLGKVPALALDDGTTLFDSPVICAWLDARGDGPALVPAAGPERFLVLRAEALADGIMDLAVGLTMERRKPEDERSPTMAARWRDQLARALDAVPGEVQQLPGELTLGHLALAVALAYVEFRHPEIGWRDGRPELAAWFETLATRPSLAETAPQ
jgi:glutathione S-transferase